jgi:predicted phosphoribosyltransferase
MLTTMFRNRDVAGEQLGRRLQERLFHDALVLAIPNGGVVVGSALAEVLNAELDVLLIRRLAAPGNPEVTIGAVSEGGAIYLNHHGSAVQAGLSEDYVRREIREQLEMLGTRRRLIRSLRRPARITGRSVIVTDDGIVTGTTMHAALTVVRAQSPHELIVAVPVVPRNQIEDVRQNCDELVYVLAPELPEPLGDFYADFPKIEDAQVAELMRASFAHSPCSAIQAHG